jgi:hypothetical protein
MTVRPVDHFAGDQVFIGDEMLGAVPGDDGAIAASQGIDLAVRVFQLYHIAGLDGFVPQEDETAHQVGKDLLQAKTEPQPQGAAEQGEDGEIEPR